MYEFIFSTIRGNKLAHLLIDNTAASTIAEPSPCPCWREPGTGAPQRCVVQLGCAPVCLRPGCVAARQQADGQQTLGSFQTQSGPSPPHASAACPSPRSQPPCQTDLWCWRGPPQHDAPSLGWRECRSPNTAKQENKEKMKRDLIKCFYLAPWQPSVCRQSFGITHRLLFYVTFSFFLLLMILSSPLKAPDATKRMFVVSTCTVSPLSFLEFFSGTLTTVPSRSLSKPCRKHIRS